MARASKARKIDELRGRNVGVAEAGAHFLDAAAGGDERAGVRRGEAREGRAALAYDLKSLSGLGLHRRLGRNLLPLPRWALVPSHEPHPRPSAPVALAATDLRQPETSAHTGDQWVDLLMRTVLCKQEVAGSRPAGSIAEASMRGGVFP